jgi:hypothetical protein
LRAFPQKFPRIVYDVIDEVTCKFKVVIVCRRTVFIASITKIISGG